MRWQTWQELHRELRKCPWFENVGQDLVRPEDGTRIVNSWDEATQWSEAKISWRAVQKLRTRFARQKSDWIRLPSVNGCPAEGWSFCLSTDRFLGALPRFGRKRRLRCGSVAGRFAVKC